MAYSGAYSQNRNVQKFELNGVYYETTDRAEAANLIAKGATTVLFIPEALSGSVPIRNSAGTVIYTPENWQQPEIGKSEPCTDCAENLTATAPKEIKESFFQRNKKMFIILGVLVLIVVLLLLGKYKFNWF